MTKRILLHVFIALSVLPMVEAHEDVKTIPPEWSALLHAENGSSQILKGDFFTTESGNIRAELEQLKAHLSGSEPNDPLITACTFPARTRWIIAQEKNKIPTPDWAKCSELISFRKSFGEVTAVSLIFASEVASVPASAFGHTLLAFHSGDSPSLESNVVEYAAEVDPENEFIRYLWNGLSGGFRGVFTRQPLFKKLHTYSKEERRRLFVYRLNLSKTQIDTLIDHLFELRNAEFKYYFLTQNCGYQLEKLLEVVGERRVKKPYFYGLPIETLSARPSLIIPGTTIEALETRAKKSLDELSLADAERFNSIYFEEGKLPSEASESLKRSLTLYAEYDFRTRREVHPQYSTFSKFKYTNSPLTTPNTGDYRDEALIRSPRRLMIQYSPKLNQPVSSFWLDFRPVLRDLREPRLTNDQDSLFTLFNPRLQLQSRKVSLHSLTFMEITSLPQHTSKFPSGSWRLYSALDRNNLDSQVRFTNEYELGKTLPLSQIGGIGAMVGIGAETAFNNFSGFLTAESYSYFDFTSWLRFGARAHLKLYSSGKHVTWSTFLRGDFISYGLDFEVTRESLTTPAQYRVGTLFYF